MCRFGLPQGSLEFPDDLEAALETALEPDSILTMRIFVLGLILPGQAASLAATGLPDVLAGINGEIAHADTFDNDRSRAGIRADYMLNQSALRKTSPRCSDAVDAHPSPRQVASPTT